MKRKAKPVLVGLFVLVGIALAIGSVVLLGARRFAGEGHVLVSYFTGDLRGLSTGSAVVFKGVKVGEVTNIQLIFDRDDKVFVAVQYALHADVGTIHPGSRLARGTPQERMQECIKMGLCAKVVPQSFVTGMSMIELKISSKSDRKFADHKGEGTEIPTVPSDMEKLRSSLNELPLRETFERLVSVMEGLDKRINSPELANTVKALEKAVNNLDRLLTNTDKQVNTLGVSAQMTLSEANALLKQLRTQLTTLSKNANKALASADAAFVDIRKTSSSVDKQVNVAGPKLAKALDSATASMKQLDSSLQEVSKAVDARSPIRQDLQETLDQVSRAAASLKALTDYLNRHPDSLLRGKRSK